MAALFPSRLLQHSRCLSLSLQNHQVLGDELELLGGFHPEGITVGAFGLSQGFGPHQCSEQCRIGRLDGSMICGDLRGGHADMAFTPFRALKQSGHGVIEYHPSFMTGRANFSSKGR
jgi:hypothetical protein